MLSFVIRVSPSADIAVHVLFVSAVLLFVVLFVSTMLLFDVVLFLSTELLFDSEVAAVLMDAVVCYPGFPFCRSGPAVSFFVPSV